MDFKEAYIDKMICHRFSLDKQRSLVNHKEMDMGKLDQAFLKDFFIKPFSREKSEYTFVHSIDLKYNIIYNTVLDMFQGGDFVNDSISIYKHLESVSSLPTIKDGDIFIVKIEDVLNGNAYCDAIGIFKIETKNEFIETAVDRNGYLDIRVKTGYTSQKIDKACLIVFTEVMPVGYIIDRSKDTKFWYHDFLGMAIKQTSYNQSKALTGMMEGFIKEKLAKENVMPKCEQIELVNHYTSLLSHADVIDLAELQEQVFQDKKLSDMFDEYRKIYEERENVSFDSRLTLSHSATNMSKKYRKISLDDTVELYLLKTGDFVERGYDDARGKYYYKLFFSKEK